MPLVRYRSLGRSGLRVTAVSLGSWLTYGGSVDDAVARACIDHAWELGVRFFDTANVYAGGKAEVVVGRTLASRPREAYVLATKLFWPMGDTPNERGLSRKAVLEQCHASLRRLGVDHIDLYQCHRYDPETPLEETCRAMDDLIHRGSVLYWGVSEWTAEQITEAVELCRAAGYAPPVSNQPQYSALYRRIEVDVLPACARLGLGNVVWSPLAMGILTGKYRSVDELPPGSRATTASGGFMRQFLTQRVLDAVAELRGVAADAGCTLAQLALAWCLRRPEVSSVIVGASRPGQLDQTIAAADLDLDAGLFDAVDRLLGPVAADG
jgi:voltage-dependent potassium channel beta subunit